MTGGLWPGFGGKWVNAPLTETVFQWQSRVWEEADGLH